MSLRSNFKFHECDKRVVFKNAYRVISGTAANYDLLRDGRPVILMENDRGEKYSSAVVARQIQAVAYHSREAMVRTCLDVCRHLVQPSAAPKLLVNGCFFLKMAITDVWDQLFHFPENPVFDGFLEDIPQREPSFYNDSFWGSSIVQSWLVVHTVYNWYELCMPRWSTSEADKLVNGYNDSTFAVYH